MNIPRSLIIAGGKGSRFGGLTTTRPKHVVPVLGIPLVDHHIQALEGVSPIRFSYSGFNQDFLDRYFEENHAERIKEGSLIPQLDLEMKGPLFPLVELVAERHAKKEEGDVIALTGDMFGHVDLAELTQFHQQQGRPITLVATRTFPAPKACVFDVNGNNALDGFRRLEGVSAEEDLINLGVYVASPELLQVIGTGLPKYKEDVIFDILAKEGALSVYVAEGRAVNINTPYQFLCANLDELRRHVAAGDTVEGRIDLETKTYVGNFATVSPDAKVSDSVICPGSVVEPGAKLKNVVLLQDTYVDSGTKLENVIVDQGVRLENATLRDTIALSQGELQPMPMHYTFED